MQTFISVRKTPPPFHHAGGEIISRQPPRVLPMAATAISLHLRPNRHRLLQNPNFIHFFSSSSSSDDSTSPPPPPQSQFSSYFNDVKASLKQSPPPQSQPRRSFSPYFTNPSSSKGASLEEIRQNLSEFRRRTTAPPPNLPEQQPISFQQLYKRNATGKDDPIKPGGKPGLPQIDAIKQRLNQMKSNLQDRGGEGPRITVDENLNWGTGNKNSGNFIKLQSFLEKGTGDKKPMPNLMGMEFAKKYNHRDMGVKLRNLRPEVKGKNWFSLAELKDRLKKLREMEDKETESTLSGSYYKDLKHSLVILGDGDKAKKMPIHKLDILGQLGGTPDFMLLPPQERLVEKYFHPDNMSSGEKLKIELKKVRDEFKMSESDCGSARVVVAQLTTKIKHLSSVLHKKDKHSRKGLQGMVQQRKKLLKYLRRTDWDSYCFVLSRLGLRDNPDYKS